MGQIGLTKQIFLIKSVHIDNYINLLKLLRLEITFLAKWKSKPEKLTKYLKKHPSKDSRTRTIAGLDQFRVEV